MVRFLGLDELFEGRHFDREIIVLCVRWYLRFKLSFRDLVEMMAERGLSLVHTTIMRWVHHYTPEFERRWQRFARPVGSSWRVDETYVKIRGKWVYLYRAVDRDGRTVDFRSQGKLHQNPSGQARYKDAAIQTTLMVRTAFRLGLRQTEGLMASVITLGAKSVWRSMPATA
jgi:DDE domain